MPNAEPGFVSHCFSTWRNKTPTAAEDVAWADRVNPLISTKAPALSTGQHKKLFTPARTVNDTVGIVDTWREITSLFAETQGDKEYCQPPVVAEIQTVASEALASDPDIRFSVLQFHAKQASNLDYCLSQTPNIYRALWSSDEADAHRWRDGILVWVQNATTEWTDLRDALFRSHFREKSAGDGVWLEAYSRYWRDAKGLYEQSIEGAEPDGARSAATRFRDEAQESGVELRDLSIRVYRQVTESRMTAKNIQSIVSSCPRRLR